MKAPRIHLAATASLLLLTACVFQADGSPTATSPTPSPHSVEEFWSEAEAIAREWRGDAYPKRVTVHLDMPNDRSSFSGVMFLFEAPSEDLARYRVACDESGCEPDVIEQEPGSIFYCKPFTTSDFEIDSAEALAIGLSEGGSEYLQRERGDVAIHLSYGISICHDPLRWSVRFYDHALRGESLWVEINAMTGEVIDRWHT